MSDCINIFLSWDPSGIGYWWLILSEYLGQVDSVESVEPVPPVPRILESSRRIYEPKIVELLEPVSEVPPFPPIPQFRLKDENIFPQIVTK